MIPSTKALLTSDELKSLLDIIPATQQTLKGNTMSTSLNIVNMAKAVAKQQDTIVSINDKLNSSVIEFIKAFNKDDYSKKDLFINLLNCYRTNKDDSKTLLELGTLFNKYSSNTTILKRLKGIAVIAKEAYKTKLVIKLDMAYFYNIEDSLKVLIALNEDEAKKTIFRNSLFSCYDRADKMESYNNKVSSKIKELRKQFNMNDINGVTVVSTLKDKIDKLSQAELKELETYILSKISK